MFKNDSQDLYQLTGKNAGKQALGGTYRKAIVVEQERKLKEGGE